MMKNEVSVQQLSVIAAGKTGTVVALTGGRHFQRPSRQYGHPCRL